MPPRALRPRMDAERVRALGLVHIANLDLMAKGQAGAEVLLQVMGGTLTWHRVAQVLGRGEAEMVDQLELMNAVFERFRAHGRVLFTGLEYQRAKHGVDVQDALAELVDEHTAVEAATWSEAQVHRLQLEKQT
jgi:hypothetical protein